MDSLAIVGFGNHVNKNILPALNKIKDISIEAVYVRDVNKYSQAALSHLLKLKNITLLPSTEANWVYVSTPIASHYEYVKQALQSGKHVICEKPLTDSFEKTQELFDVADELKCHLHEVCMYTHHKQYHYLKELVGSLGDKIKVVHAKFSIPHLEKTDIRYQKELGGGALLDVGYYPLSIMVNLFGAPNHVRSVTKSEIGFTVDLTGSAILEYDNFHCLAEWGIGLNYANELTINSIDCDYYFNRIFSKPPSFNSTVVISRGFENESKELGEDDHFKNLFYSYVKKLIKKEVSNTKTIALILGKIF